MCAGRQAAERVCVEHRGGDAGDHVRAEGLLPVEDGRHGCGLAGLEVEQRRNDCRRAEVECNRVAARRCVAGLDGDQDVVAQDCGPISNSDGLRNQTEGGILQGMSRALMEEVTWNDKRVTSIDWETYKSHYLGFELPAIEIILINRLGVPANGAGETAITVVPAAIGNAIFDATGIRLREVPFTAERVRAALARIEK